MKSIETVSLIGLGAVGCTYFAKLSDALPQGGLRVIASGERAKRYREHGVLINGTRHPVHAVTPDESASPADLLIFAVKNTQLDEAIREARGHMGPKTIVLSLLNGVVSEDKIRAAYGTDNALYSYVVGIDSTRTGENTIFRNDGRIPFGDARNTPGEYSENVRRVEALFRKAGIQYEIPEDMIRSLWFKFMMNVGVNQVSAALGADYGAFQRCGSVQELYRDAMLEAVAVAGKEGIRLTQEDIAAAMEIVRVISPEGKTSMLQDVEAGRKTEVEVFGQTVVELGAKHGVATPVNQILLRLIRAREEMAEQ